MKEAVLFSGRNNFNVIVDSIRQLPRRLLNAWLEATVIDENGNSLVYFIFDNLVLGLSNGFICKCQT